MKISFYYILINHIGHMYIKNVKFYYNFTKFITKRFGKSLLFPASDSQLGFRLTPAKSKLKLVV